MASTPQQNGEGGPTAAHGNHVENEAVTGTSLDWEEFEVDIGWGTMRGKIRGSGPELMLGE